MQPEDPKHSTAYLKGRIEALHTLLEATVVALPERAAGYVQSEAQRIRLEAERERDRRHTAVTRDYSAGVWDTATPIDATLEQSISELRAGTRARTIQPAPAPHAGQPDPGKDS